MCPSLSPYLSLSFYLSNSVYSLFAFFLLSISFSFICVSLEWDPWDTSFVCCEMEWKSEWEKEMGRERERERERDRERKENERDGQINRLNQLWRRHQRWTTALEIYLEMHYLVRSVGSALGTGVGAVEVETKAVSACSLFLRKSLLWKYTHTQDKLVWEVTEKEKKR